jgi:hypothetical protein
MRKIQGLMTEESDQRRRECRLAPRLWSDVVPAVWGKGIPIEATFTGTLLGWAMEYGGRRGHRGDRRASAPRALVKILSGARSARDMTMCRSEYFPCARSAPRAERRRRRGIGSPEQRRWSAAGPLFALPRVCREPPRTIGHYRTTQRIATGGAGEGM